MIQEFVDRFMANKAVLREMFAAGHPGSYEDIVRNVVLVLHDDSKYSSIDAERIHEIDDGHYQGTLVYVIGGSGYQPSSYWYVKVAYGSCSGCDTLEAIRGYRDEKPSEEQIDDYMTLSLHVVQGLKEMGQDIV